MTLHEAMVQVLTEHNGWMSRDDLAREIADRELYRQRAGGPAPSDQLRLRARKHPELFEGSDPTFTRIRLTQSNRSDVRDAGRGEPPLVEEGQPARTSGSQTRTAAAGRDCRAAAAEKYKPEQVRLLLVAEAPPAALDRYFYFEDVREHDSLFRYVVRGILGVEPLRDGKRPALEQLRDRGVFLLDLCEEPLGNVPLGSYVPDLVDRATTLAPEWIILIKATVYDAAFSALKSAGLPVVDARIPFPGSGQQRRFEREFAEALELIGL